MLCAEAMRLAAVEALAPTVAISSGGPFPTIARSRIFDSRPIAIEELDPFEGFDFTPTVALYTDDSQSTRRGDSATSAIGFAKATLTAVCELAVKISDDDEPYADAMASGSADAKLVLGALCAQVKQALTVGPSGAHFRRIVKSIDEVRCDAFALPDMGMRWMRTTMRMSCSIADDEFTDAAGLPQPIQRLLMNLPDESYAKAKLQQLDGFFQATTRT